ncbi:MAG: sensor histidine kinase [Spirosomaceae bacterium]|jgi:LytS/YehU family sensor histidine kinase|nr:sensor histidine kinase [Spirosomataceae bacterium]
MKKIVVIALHLGYWLLYLLLLLLILLCLQIGTNLKQQPLFENHRFAIFFTTFAVLPAILGFYNFYFWVFDYFLLRRKIFLLFLVGLLVSFASGFISASVITALHWFKIGPGVFSESLSISLQITFIISIIALLNGIVALVIKGFISWYNDIKLKEQLMQRNFETELALVKAQLSPHFLFNTLNNIDVLITKNTEQASQYLNQLSDILRFMLYETKGECIALSEEWAYLEKYVALQKIRTSNLGFVTLEKLGNFSNVQIAPMTLIPFVENAFKHAPHLRHGNVIRIMLEVQEKTLVFLCENKIAQNTQKELPSPLQNSPSHNRKGGRGVGSGGLGNELIQKRLLLLYPDSHLLEITSNDDVYQVKLELQWQ